MEELENVDLDFIFDDSWVRKGKKIMLTDFNLLDVFEDDFIETKRNTPVNS